jgi:hypothetical protein
VIEREVGTGFAIAIAVLVVAALAVWGHRRPTALAGDREGRDGG